MSASGHPPQLVGLDSNSDPNEDIREGTDRNQGRDTDTRTDAYHEVIKVHLLVPFLEEHKGVIVRSSMIYHQ